MSGPTDVTGFFCAAAAALPTAAHGLPGRVTKLGANRRLMARPHRVLWLIVGLAACGCSRAPQMAPGNQRLIQSLHTAVSSHRSDWLETNAKLVEERRSASQMSDEEYAAFESIIADARTGNWSRALSNVKALAKAQRRTPEEVAKLKSEPRRP